MIKSNVIIAALAAVILAVFGFGLGSFHDPMPLVGPSGWTVTGQFPSLPDKPLPQQVPDSMSGDASFVMFRSWTKEGGAKGTVTSPPFRAAPYMALPFARGEQRGYPNPDLLYLRCQATGSTWNVSSAQTFYEWNIAYEHVPTSFCADNVVLVATSNGAFPHGYLGVATPFSVSRATYLVHSGFGARGAILILSWVAFALIGFASAVVLAPIGLDALSSAVIGIGMSGMAVFAAGVVDFRLSAYASVVLVVVSMLAFLSSRRRQIWSELHSPMSLWLAVGMCIFLFVASLDNGGGRWAANAMFSPLSWSVDNQNPVFFAYEFVHAQTASSLISGQWYFDDRTPLLTVLLIIPQTLFIEPLARLAGSDFIYTADTAVGILMLALWVPVLLWFSRLVVVRHRILFVAIVAISPFMLFNTAYTWGKMLGAAYMLLAVGLTLLPDRRNLALIPAALALSYLSHSGNAISAVAFLIVFAHVLRRSDTKALAWGTLAALAIVVPWGYWTHFLQPNGNALTRLSLANDTGFDYRSKSVLASMVQYLKDTGLAQWLALKAQALHVTVDVLQKIALPRPIDNRAADVIGNLRSADFSVPARTIGIATIGVVLAIVRGNAFQLKMILCGALGIIAMVLLTVGIGIMPSQAYGSVILLAVGGALCLADVRSVWPSVMFSAWLAYFLATSGDRGR